ncbi:hypothetical protein A6R68_18544 [Neotoma lepida]|uniref:Uncharacterized protein n=1 Tax=Neotoma lepida TaxID=56216 RepID=A0A1A6HKL2_NEOLE|nr:hypothetical protein A6R68_18544 [Neotoma lepida]
MWVAQLHHRPVVGFCVDPYIYTPPPGYKIIHCFWNGLSKESKGHSAYRFISNSEIKEYLRKMNNPSVAF